VSAAIASQVAHAAHARAMCDQDYPDSEIRAAAAFLGLTHMLPEPQAALAFDKEVNDA